MTRSQRECSSFHIARNAINKRPRELRYLGDGGFEWGFQIPEDGPRHQWFKLDLDPSQRSTVSDLAKRYPSRNALPPGYDVEPEKLVEDYFTALHQHVGRVLNHRLPQAALKNTAIEYIITYVEKTKFFAEQPTANSIYYDQDTCSMVGTCAGTHEKMCRKSRYGFWNRDPDHLGA